MDPEIESTEVDEVEGFTVWIISYDSDGFILEVHMIVKDSKNEALEALCGAKYCATYEEAIAQADVVSVHVPLLPATHHLINADRLALMKKSAILINTSRGPVVDEVALAQALKAGTIRGAGLDVFEFEPKVTQELLTLENVVVNPHLASATEETRTKMAEMVATNIIEVLEGRTAPNAVA